LTQNILKIQKAEVWTEAGTSYNEVFQMFEKILAAVTQEPPVPTPREFPSMLPNPLIYVAIAIVVAGIIAWRYKAILEFIVILCSTIGGFIIGLVLTPPYANVGLGIMVSIAGLLISVAIVTIIRLLKASG
jgi:hypothetical protein